MQTIQTIQNDFVSDCEAIHGPKTPLLKELGAGWCLYPCRDTAEAMIACNGKFVIDMRCIKASGRAQLTRACSPAPVAAADALDRYMDEIDRSGRCRTAPFVESRRCRVALSSAKVAYSLKAVWWLHKHAKNVKKAEWHVRGDDDWSTVDYKHPLDLSTPDGLVARILPIQTS